MINADMTSKSPISDLRMEHTRANFQRRVYTGLIALAIVISLWLGFFQANELSSGDLKTGIWRVFEYPQSMVAEAIQFGLIPFLSLLIIFFPVLLETLNIALLATLIGTLAGCLLGILGSRNLRVPSAIVFLTRRVLDVMRAFPELVIALFLIYLLGASPIPAIIAITVHTTGVIGKLFSELNESVDQNAIVGLQAAGASWTQQIIFGVLPQVVSHYVSYILLRIEINVRASTILGFVGAGGIGAELRRTISWGVGQGHQTIALFVLIFLFIVVVDQGSTMIRRRIIGHGGRVL